METFVIRIFLADGAPDCPGFIERPGSGRRLRFVRLADLPGLLDRALAAGGGDDAPDLEPDASLRDGTPDARPRDG